MASKEFEDKIIDRVERIRAGGSHEFTARGVELLFERFEQIKEKRQMEINALHRGTKE